MRISSPIKVCAPVVGTSNSPDKFWLLDIIEICLIWLAIANFW